MRSETSVFGVLPTDMSLQADDREHSSVPCFDNTPFSKEENTRRVVPIGFQDVTVLLLLLVATDDGESLLMLQLYNSLFFRSRLIHSFPNNQHNLT